LSTLNGWTRKYKHPNITENFYEKIDAPTDLDDAHIRMTCHNHAVEDCELQIQIHDISCSLKYDNDNIAPYQEEEIDEMENRKLRLLAGKRFHLTAARAYWYYLVKVNKTNIN
jgi:hypothetical protein